MPTTGSRLAAWLALFGRGATLAAFVVYALAFLATNYAVNAIAVRPDVVNPGQLSLVLFGVGVLQFLAWALAALFLARRLGGDPARTATGSWLLLTLVYLAVGIWLPAVISSAVVFYAGQVALATVIGLVLGFIMFPLVVRLVAVAHSANDLSLNAIVAWLVGEGVGLFVLFIVIDVAWFLLNIVINQAAGSGMGAFVILQLFNALHGTALILFAIMAYREIRATFSPPA